MNPDKGGEAFEWEDKKETLMAIATLIEQQRSTVSTVDKLVSRLEHFGERLLKLESIQQVGMTEKQVKQADSDGRYARYAIYISVAAMISQWFPTAIQSIIKLLTGPQ